MIETRCSKTCKQLKPLAQQFALTALKLQMFGDQTCHVYHSIRTCFLVSCPRLNAIDGISPTLEC